MTITWSYSGHKTFAQCPRQYNEVKILKKYKSEDTPALEYGRLVHEAIEHYLKYDIPLTGRFARFAEHAQRVKNLKGKHLIEHPMGLRKDGTPCRFDEQGVWWRGIPDALVVNEEKGLAHVADWKTSKSARYADTDQLELLALATFAKFPAVQKVKAALIFIVCDAVVPKTYTRDQFADILSKWIGNISLIESAMETDVWNPKQSALCRFCPVSTDACEYAS